VKGEGWRMARGKPPLTTHRSPLTPFRPGRITNHDSRRYCLLLAGKHVDKAYAAGQAIHREIPPIGGQDLPYSTAGRQQHDRSIGEVHGLVGVLAGEFLDCPEVHGIPINSEQSGLGGVAQPVETPHLLFMRKQCQRFGQHRLGGKESSPVIPQKPAAAGVQGVRLVEQPDQETRVNDDVSHERSRGSAAGGKGVPYEPPASGRPAKRPRRDCRALARSEPRDIERRPVARRGCVSARPARNGDRAPRRAPGRAGQRGGHGPLSYNQVYCMTRRLATPNVGAYPSPITGSSLC